MYSQSGEWVTILKVKENVIKIVKSLWFRIWVLLILVSSIPCFILQGTILKSYEKRAVSWRAAEIQSECTILCNQLVSTDYLTNPVSEVINSELYMLSSVYGGRVMVIDADYRIVKDTFGVETGKTIVSPDVIKCFAGAGTTYYDAKTGVIEITTPIIQKTGSERSGNENTVKGVMLVSVSTDIINSTLSILERNANVVIYMLMLVVSVVGGFLAVYLAKPFKKIAESIRDITSGFDNEELAVNTYTDTQDISESINQMRSRMKVLDDSRQEFVSNVSHELKTPLTSMKVLADSLLAQDNVPVELYQEFMADIAEEIERENVIINDLLSLVKMDRASSDLNVKTENINEVVERILKRLRPIAAQKNIELVFESFRPITAEVDEVKLSLAISNFVENAIKYNKENGWVQVSLNADHKYFYVKVADSGIGIPQEDLDHIFERFYRVDKSHSKAISGTGLGLAIARNAVIVHRGAVKVHSEEGVGTVFTIRIPLKYIV